MVVVEERTGSGTAVSHWRIGSELRRATCMCRERDEEKGWRDERAGGLLLLVEVSFPVSLLELARTGQDGELALGKVYAALVELVIQGRD